jgi:hypothetical protein
VFYSETEFMSWLDHVGVYDLGQNIKLLTQRS